MKFCTDVVSQLELPVNQSCLNRFTSRLLNVCASKQLLQKLMLYMSKQIPTPRLISQTILITLAQVLTRHLSLRRRGQRCHCEVINTVSRLTCHFQIGYVSSKASPSGCPSRMQQQLSLTCIKASNK